MDLDAEIQKNKALEGDVENFQRRQRFQDEIKVLEQKRPWLEYEAKRLEFSREKDKLKEKVTGGESWWMNVGMNENNGRMRECLQEAMLINDIDILKKN